MTKDEAVKEYRKLSRKLFSMQSKAANHISRKDNNRVFNTAIWLNDVAERIKVEYDLDPKDPYFD